MTAHRFVAVPLLLLAVVTAPDCRAAAEEWDGATAPEVVGALEAARSGAVDGFGLRVASSSADGFRSVEVFERGVAIWNGRAQIRLTSEVRSAVLDRLLDSGFAGFEASYGGRPPREGEAALRVIRQVALEIGDVSKLSVQLADGEQSAELEGLAESLLDLIEPLAEEGVTADALDDGLAKLAAGALAPETLTLRLVEVPPAQGDEVGSILRVEQGRASRQPYAPGRAFGEAEAIELTDEAFGGMVAALRRADPASLPVNLWSPRHVELEVKLLQHQHTVIARPFSRRSPDEDAAARGRFDELVATLDVIGVEPVVAPESEDASD